MRHKYETRGIVLARTHTGEATTIVTLITPELGLLRARAQSLRASGAKLAHALTTLAESSLVLVRGRDGWRVAGAMLEENWFVRLEEASAKQTAGRVSSLLLRLVAGEATDAELFPIIAAFLEALVALPEAEHDAVEVITALRILRALGLDAGEIPGDATDFAPATLQAVAQSRTAYITRINHGITASGL
ncbi:MAG: repair protein RecO, repair protein RecO [Parcubacteria group bacterium]|nr:repair protein RecO, repair protein RecO [Parcubacteria group bacterium]